MIKKSFYMDDEHVAMIKDLMDKNPEFKTESAALRFVLEEYKKQCNIEDLIQEVLLKVEESRNAFEMRLKWATTTSEQNSIILIDAINTMLIKNKIDDCVPVDIMESPVISESRRRMKDRLAYFKLKKDNKKRKYNKKNDT